MRELNCGIFWLNMNSLMRKARIESKCMVDRKELSMFGIASSYSLNFNMSNIKTLFAHNRGKFVCIYAKLVYTVQTLSCSSTCEPLSLINVVFTKNDSDVYVIQLGDPFGLSDGSQLNY